MTVDQCRGAFNAIKQVINSLETTETFVEGQCYNAVCVLGDFNASLRHNSGAFRDDARGKEIRTFCQDLGLQLMETNGPIQSRFTTIGSAEGRNKWRDLVLIRDLTHAVLTVEQQYMDSDHFPVVIEYTPNGPASHLSNRMHATKKWKTAMLSDERIANEYSRELHNDGRSWNKTFYGTITRCTHRSVRTKCFQR